MKTVVFYARDGRTNEDTGATRDKYAFFETTRSVNVRGGLICRVPSRSQIRNTRARARTSVGTTGQENGFS